LTALLGYLFIFFARVCDVSMATVRTLFIVKGKRFQAAVIGFFEVIVYILALSSVVGKLNNPLNLLAYALGFATGNYVGSYIEERIALGNLLVQIVPSTNQEEMVLKLRESGFGVTVIEACGREGMRYILNVLIKRKDLCRLYEIVDALDEKPFITILDARSIKGGYITSFDNGKRK